MPNAIISAVPEGRTSEAIGMMSVIRGMFAAIGAQLIAVSLASDMIVSPDGTASFPSAAGFRLTMAWIGGLTFVAAFAGLFLRGREPAAKAATAPA